MDFSSISKALYQIATTGSILQKEYLLKKYGDNLDGFKDVLKFIYDPYFTTGIGQKKMDRVDIDTAEISAEQIMEYLRKYTTGTDYDASYALGFIYQETEDDIWQWAATGLVTKDLQIGVSVTTLNKVYGAGFIPIIGIMRGTLCPTNAKGIFIATEKIDGNRRIIMNKPTGVEIYTRSGRRDHGLVEIEDQAKMLPIGYVFDTECIATGDYKDSIELRQASASILNSRGKRSGVKALCFDCLPQSEYDAGISKHAAFGRKALLAGFFGDRESHDMMHSWFMKHDMHLVANSINAIFCFAVHKAIKLPNIDCLPILGIATTRDEGIALAQPIWETGGEGVMLVDYKSPYEVNPNPRKTLLKIKATQEFTLKCTGIFGGNNKYSGMLGGIKLAYKASDNKTYYVDCGSGFTDYMREEYYQHPEKIAGKYVEIESFGETRNAQGGYSLNCPIFKRIRGERE